MIKRVFKEVVFWGVTVTASFVGSAWLTVVDTGVLNSIAWPVLAVWVGVQLAVVAILAGELPVIQVTLIERLKRKSVMTAEQEAAVRHRVEAPLREVRHNVRIGVIAMLLLAGIIAWASMDIPWVGWPDRLPISKVQCVYALSAIVFMTVFRAVWDTVEATFSLGTLKSFMEETVEPSEKGT